MDNTPPFANRTLLVFATTYLLRFRVRNKLQLIKLQLAPLSSKNSNFYLLTRPTMPNNDVSKGSNVPLNSWKLLSFLTECYCYYYFSTTTNQNYWQTNYLSSGFTGCSLVVYSRVQRSSKVLPSILHGWKQPTCLSHHRWYLPKLPGHVTAGNSHACSDHAYHNSGNLYLVGHLYLFCHPHKLYCSLP